MKRNILKNVDNEIIKEFDKLPLDFWDFKNDDTKGLTHGIHSYPAVMIYPISRNIISIVKKYQNIKTLMDPFMGSGTSLVEGILADIDVVYGTDLNPLARLISTVKTKHLNYSNVKQDIDELLVNIDEKYIKYEVLLDNIYNYIEEHDIDITAKATFKEDWGHNANHILNDFMDTKDLSFEIPNFKNMGYWFLPHVILELQIIKNCIMKISDVDIQKFIWVAFSETTRLVSNRRNGEFKMYRMTPEKVLNYRPDVKEKFIDILQKNLDKMKDFYNICDLKNKETKVHILDNDTRSLEDVPDNSIDIVVTSPPYGDSRTTVAYGEFSRVSLQWANLEDLEHKDIAGIDKSLMGGTKFRHGFDNKVLSKTLEISLNRILEDDKNIERAGDVYSFYYDMQNCIKAITDKSKVNSYQFWVVANRTVKKEVMKTSDIIVEIGSHLGLEHVYTMGRNISNKQMPSKNSPTNKAGEKVSTMTDEHIIVLRKSKDTFN